MSNSLLVLNMRHEENKQVSFITFAIRESSLSTNKSEKLLPAEHSHLFHPHKTAILEITPDLIQHFKELTERLETEYNEKQAKEAKIKENEALEEAKATKKSKE